MRASCTSDGMRVSSSMRATAPRSMARMTGLGTTAAARRAFGQQPGVVPAVADGLLGRARRALDEEGGVAGDGGGEMLRHPGLGRAGHAEEQQGPVGGQRGDGHLDEAALADVLGRDLGAVGQRAAEQVGGHRPGRQPPAGRSRPVVGGGQRGQLGGVDGPRRGAGRCRRGDDGGGVAS